MDDKVISRSKATSLKKKAMDALQKSEEFYRAITQNSVDIIIIVNRIGKIIYVSPSIERCCGYRPEELIGNNAFDYIGLTDAARAVSDFGRAILTKGVAIPNAFQVLHKAGSVRILEGVGTNLFDNPAVAGFVMNVRDITERKKSEYALQQSENKYRFLVENAIEGIVIIQDGVFKFVNPIARLVLGYSQEEIISMPALSIIHDNDKAAVKKIIEDDAGSSSAPIVLTIQAVTKQGNTRLLENYILSMIWEDRPAKLFLIGDITERRQMEKYKDLTATADSMSLVDRECRYQFMNEISLSRLAMSMDKVIGRHYGEFHAPADAEQFASNVAIVFQTGKYVTYEHRSKRDGKYFSRTLSPVKDSLGQIFAVSVVSKDITELKTTQSQLEEKNIELKNTYEELRKKQAMIIQQEKMASIGLLAAGIAHEIKNPLAIILQGVDYLLSTVKDDYLLIEVIDKIKQAVLRADIIIKSLLSYSRQNILAIEEASITGLIEESLSLTEHELRMKNIRVIKQYQPNLPAIFVDRNQIKQVFVNLLINGVEAMHMGGCFTISAAQLENNAGKKSLRISFGDTGEGIPEDQIQNIFDPFFTSKSIGSTGLGLSISRGIIDRHGGTIHAESQIGVGTKMSIVLPIP